MNCTHKDYQIQKSQKNVLFIEQLFNIGELLENLNLTTVKANQGEEQMRKTTKKMNPDYNKKGQLICPDCNDFKNLKMKKYGSGSEKGTVYFTYICNKCNVKVTQIKNIKDLA